MTIVAPDVLQRYVIDSSLAKRALDDLDKSQDAQARNAVGNAEKASGAQISAAAKTGGAQRKLFEQMSLLTSAIGGQGSALGRLAFSAKALVGGFGGLGIAMLGAGYALKALDPVVDTVIDGFKEMVGFGDKRHWDPIGSRIKEITGLMEQASLQAKIWAAQLALMAPEDRAAATVLGEVGDVQRAAAANIAAQDAMTKATQARWAAQSRLNQATGFARTTEELALEVAAKRERQARIDLRTTELGLNLARLELDASKKSRDAADDAAAKAAEAARKRAQAAEDAILRQRQAYWLLEEQIRNAAAAVRQFYADSQAVGGLGGEPGMVGGGPGKAPLQALGAGSGVGIAPNMGTPLGRGGPLAGMVPPPGAKSQWAQWANQVAQATDVLGTFRDASQAAFASIVEGTASIGEAFRSMLGDFLTGMALKLFAWSIELAVQQRYAQAAAAFAGSVVVGGLARKVGGEGAPSAYGGSSGGSVQPRGASIGGGAQTTTILIDSMAGMTSRQVSARLRRLTRGRRTS